MILESFGAGGWLRWSALLAVGITAPIVGAHALMAGRSLPTFVELIGPPELADRSPVTILLGLVLAVTTLIATETALGFVFDPRYRDFPFASLSMAVVPLLSLMLINRPQAGLRPIAEQVFAGLLVASAIYVGFNESESNWQSLWTCGLYLLLALTLWRARVARMPG